MKKRIKSFREYSMERFSEVLNVQHHYSIFLLIDGFYLVTAGLFFKSTNEQRLVIIMFEICFEEKCRLQMYLCLFKEGNF